MGSFELASLAVPFVSLLICFLAFPSQYLFKHLDPRPLSHNEFIAFNANIAFLLICYVRTVVTDPGRIPKLGNEEKEPGNGDATSPDSSNAEKVARRQRWCRICDSRKPPRSHHCRKCKRCIPKMDHHCPWTGNCVSHRTFPHFFRFVASSVLAMAQLEYFLFIRIAHLWARRNMPMYHGPSATQLGHLFVLSITNTLCLLALSILILRTTWTLLWNVTTIEEWEVERHETLLRRARASGGFLDGPDGMKVRIKRQEFPYDIGIWANISQGMGTWNALAWFWPFSATPTLESGLDYETNGFEDPAIGWPPPDPDRIPRLARNYEDNGCNRDSDDEFTTRREFRKRQAEDLKRWNASYGRTRSSSNATSYSLSVPPTTVPAGGTDSSPTPLVKRRQPFHKRYDAEALKSNDTSNPDLFIDGDGEGEEAWRNTEGERLQDFGVDEEAEFYDEDEISLAELLRRRRQEAKTK
ncbi:zf-DHHC-domain-containing protein [Microthyrium microscopicum]|uniref:Palmitoyltransferase PFA4 n=1 Tax=Microthyrium microscopicum TaxID=703497 RepID=A0A6A6USN8_9PEZI|nr:zf-DHHC-domain-containing protein [Microthyrium microscopicum]